MDDMTTPIENLMPKQQMPQQQPVPDSYNEVLQKLQQETMPPPPMNTYQPPVPQFPQQMPQPQGILKKPQVESDELDLNSALSNELINICIIGIILHSPFVQEYAQRSLASLYKNNEPTLLSAIFFGVLTAVMFIVFKKVNIKIN